MKKKTWRKILTSILLVLVASSAWIGYTSNRYGLPWSEVAAQSLRYVILRAVCFGVDSVYDPTLDSTRHAILSPADSSEVNTSLPRIETFLATHHFPGIHLVKVHNEVIITSPYFFSYQPDVPRLHDMRKAMGLDHVVAGAKDELETMIRLRNWVRSQFGRLDYQKKMDRFDALSIWKNPQRNPEGKKNRPENYNPCHFFPLFYSQVLIAMGYTPRLVGITYTGYGAHGFVEVWSNQYRKWVSMDPDLNLYYLSNQEPQNMLEVHNARYVATPDLIVNQVMIEPGVQPKETVANMLEYHKYIKIADLRNDWLTNRYFPGHPKRSDLATLFWQDNREKAVWRTCPVTSNKNDMYWSLNQSEILVNPEKSTKGILALVFRTKTPNFSHFIVKANGRILKNKSSFFAWRLEKGENRLTVYPVNSFGIDGIPSSVTVYYDR